MLRLFPHPALAFFYVLAGAMSDRFVIKRLGLELSTLWHWALFGAAHWFWPLWLLVLAARSRVTRRWLRIAWGGWSA